MYTGLVHQTSLETIGKLKETQLELDQLILIDHPTVATLGFDNGKDSGTAPGKPENHGAHAEVKWQWQQMCTAYAFKDVPGCMTYANLMSIPELPGLYFRRRRRCWRPRRFRKGKPRARRQNTKLRLSGRIS